MKFRILQLILFAILFSYTCNAQLYINEHMAKNDSLFADAFGEYDDWIEIYNSNSFSVNLAGYFITDDDSITKSQIPFTNSSKTTIPAGGFLILWADKTPQQGEDHVNFSLSSGGEKIELYDNNLTLVDEVKFGKQSGTISEGLNVDGGVEYISFSTPTPGTTNGDVCAIIPPKLIFNEVNYNSNLLNYADDWVEFYNTTNSIVDISGWSFHDSGNKFIIPNGSLISPNGFYVVAADAATFSGVHPNINNAVGSFEFNLNSDSEELWIFSAAGCQVEKFEYSDQTPWPEEADGFGPTLSLINTSFDNDLPGSWAASTAGGASFGTPGRDNNIPNPCLTNWDSILINEVMYNPGIGNLNEWLELYNPSNNTVNLENWELHDEDSSYVFPAGITIAPKGYLVIASDPAVFTAAHPTVTNFVAPLSFGLSNAGENLYLYSPGRCMIDFVDYNDNFPWVTDPDGLGPSLSLKDPALENDKGANWGVSTGSGTPGMANTFTCQSTSAVFITLNGTRTLANATCPQNGFLYYYNPSNPDQLLFSIEANPGGIPNNVQLEVTIESILRPANPPVYTDGIFFHEDIANKHAIFGMARWWNVSYLPGSPQLPAPTKFRFYFDYSEYSDLTNAANNWNNINFSGALNVTPTLSFTKESGHVFDPYTDYNTTGVTNATNFSQSFGLEGSEIYAEYSGITELTGGSIVVKVSEQEVVVPLKVMLEGPYKEVTGLMDDKLRQFGLLPTTHPFNVAPWNYMGTDTIQPLVLDTIGNDAIVDWVLVELRDKFTPATILGTQAGLLQRDGDVVGMDGRSHLTFKNLSSGDYHVVLKHRNHMGVMTDTPVALDLFSRTIDFTSAPINGIDPVKLVNGVQLLWTGDVNADNAVTAGDRSLAWNGRNQSGYLQFDCTLDGVCNAHDRSVIWNNRNKTAQLP